MCVQCCVGFDFMDPVADLKGKEIKRATLNEVMVLPCSSISKNSKSKFDPERDPTRDPDPADRDP